MEGARQREQRRCPLPASSIYTQLQPGIKCSSSSLQAASLPLFCPDTAAEVHGPLVCAVLSLHSFTAQASLNSQQCPALPASLPPFLPASSPGMCPAHCRAGWRACSVPLDEGQSVIAWDSSDCGWSRHGGISRDVSIRPLA